MGAASKSVLSGKMGLLGSLIHNKKGGGAPAPSMITGHSTSGPGGVRRVSGLPSFASRLPGM